MNIENIKSYWLRIYSSGGICIVYGMVPVERTDVYIMRYPSIIRFAYMTPTVYTDADFTRAEIRDRNTSMTPLTRLDSTLSLSFALCVLSSGVPTGVSVVQLAIHCSCSVRSASLFPHIANTPCVYVESLLLDKGSSTH